MRINSYDDFILYMKDIAKKNKSLNPDNLPESNHFYPFSEELLGNSLNYPSLVLMPDELSVDDSHSDNIHLNFHPEFWISEGVKTGNPELEIAALKRCFNLAWDICSYIDEDYRPSGFNPNKPMLSFDPGTIKFQEHQPFGIDRMIGYRVTFTFSNPKQLTKSTNWY